GKLHGRFVEYGWTGNPQKEGRFERNRRVGVWTGWIMTGKKQWECTYDKGRIKGNKTYWDIEGRVSRLDEHDDSGYLVAATVWREGKKTFHGTYRRGAAHGIHTYWNPDGTVEARGEWRNGKPHAGVCAVPVAGDAGSWGGITRFVDCGPLEDSQ
ncbi:MAG: toxin-antitoxin system YwqK family antitoxin, partial [Planctomycetota bacterium]